jgi:DNA-binding MarR family transcriptional regulator
MADHPTTSLSSGHELLLQWVDQVAAFLARDGMPPIAGRVLGWLMVCEPAEQSAAEIAQANSASRASLTTNLHILTTMGFVTRRTHRGARTAYYRIEDHAWEQVVQRQIAAVAGFRRIASDGLALVGADSQRASRIRDAADTFAWMATVFAGAPPLPSGRPLGLADPPC